MKPAPAKKITYTDPESAFRIESDPESQLTKIYTAKGELLWVLNQYIGRKIIHLSPDGQSLILIGNNYFGGRLADNEEVNIFELYERGTLKKSYNFQMFFGLTIAEAITKFNIPQMGGGWFEMFRYVDIETLSWEKRQLKLIFRDKNTRQRSF